MRWSACAPTSAARSTSSSLRDDRAGIELRLAEAEILQLALHGQRLAVLLHDGDELLGRLDQRQVAADLHVEVAARAQEVDAHVDDRAAFLGQALGHGLAEVVT